MSLDGTALFPPLVTSGIIGTTLSLTLTNLMKNHPVIGRREEFIYGFSLYPAYFFILTFIAAFSYLFYETKALLIVGYFLILVAMIFIFRMILFIKAMTDPGLQAMLMRGGATEVLYNFWTENPYAKP